MKKFLCLSKSGINVLVENPILTNKTGLLCAISGGQDSMVSFFILFHSLFKLKNQNKKFFFLDNLLSTREILRFSVLEKSHLKTFNKNDNFGGVDIVYCQHFWQVKNFFCSEFLFQISYATKIPYTLILSPRVVLNENRAREWRKKNFSRFLELQKISTILTGQTKSDHLETNLIKLFRGMSPNSLSQEFQFYSRETIHIFFSCFSLRPNNCYFLQLKKKCIKKTNLFLFFFNKRSQIQKNSAPRFFKTQLNQKIYFVKFSSCRKKTVLLYASKNHVTFGKKSQVIVNNPGYYLHFNFTLIKGYRSSHISQELQTQQLKKFSFFSSFHSLGLSGFSRKKNFLIYKNPKSYSFCFCNQTIKNKKKTFKPIQALSRSCISKFLNLYKLPILNDRTNFNSMFSRNQIRHQFLPINRLLFGLRFRTFFYKFIFLGEDYKRKLEFDSLEFKLILKCLRNQSGKKLIKNYLSFNLIQKNELSNFSVLLKMTILNYREIELTFQQISYLELFYWVTRDSNPELIG